jgi:hypothetical protein
MCPLRRRRTFEASSEARCGMSTNRTVSQVAAGRRPRHHRLSVLSVAAFAVLASAACGGSSSPSSASNASGTPAITNAATSAAGSPTPVSSATTGTPSSTTTVALADTNPAPPDGAIQARLHVVLADVAGPSTDLFVNGKVAVNGGQPQIWLPVGYVTAYLYLEPGTYQVALAPATKGLGQALVAPLDVPMVAGHRYLVAFMGEIADKSLKPLVIDETEVAASVGAKPSDPVTITVNNLAGSTGIDYEWDGKVVNAGIPLGGYGAGITQAGGAHITVTARGPTDAVLIDEDNYSTPGDSVFGFAGPDAKSFTVLFSGSTSELGLMDFLRGFDAENLTGPSGDVPSFDTLLGAIKTAGLTDTYDSPKALLFLAPTDKAFAAMPAAERDALLNDSAALTTMLRAHTVEAYVPRGSLENNPGGNSIDRTFTNLVGDTLTIGQDWTVNGKGGGYRSWWLPNGTNVHPVDTVTFPPAP